MSSDINDISFEELISGKNETSDDPNRIIKQLEFELQRSSIFLFFFSIAIAILWVIYVTFYNSRVIGLIISLVLNKFTSFGHIHFGSLSFSVLSGKIMFRDFHWISHDFSVRIQYGWLIFKWWKPFVPKELKEDLSHMETRVVTFLDGFEFHVYNRSQNYSRLQKMFTTGTMMPEEEVKEESLEETTDKTEAKKKETPVSKLSWRDLVPVIKATVASGRFVFGNQLAPTQLIINFEDGHFTYTTKPPSTPFDDFMHDLTVRAENFKVMFVPSRNYVGPKDEAPRMMGEGFVVLQTRKIDLHYFMDQPGLVTYEIESVQMADGETIMRKTYPIFGMDVKCGKNTDVYYGPWADRQREYLWKFFYPADYQPMVPDKEPKPGEYRKFKKFEFVINLMEQATIEILFTKNEETQAIHMTASPGSYVEAMIPWLIDEDGYTTKVKGQLLIVDATTSLEYRSLVECETFEFSVTASYPSVWNEHQDWSVDFIVCKASVFLIFHHKHFFKGLIDDWSTTSVPDLYHFVPYTWTINLQIKDFELVLLSNEYNWIDTSSSYAENAHIAFCGSVLDLTLVLPYTDFMPKTVTMGLAIKGEDAFCRFYLPENNTSRHVVMAISKNLKLMDREGNLIEEPFKTDKKHWRNFTKESDGWIDCWCTKNVAISINYTYHPMPPLRQYSETWTPDQSRVTSPDQEEKLLHPLRPPRTALPTGPPEGFDPGLMDHDLIALELEVAPSMLCVYGSLLRNFLHVKENYLGEDQDFADFYGTASNKAKDGGTLGPLLAGEMEDSEPFDVRDHRPFAVTVSVAIHDIHGHLVKNCNMENLPCPSVLVERLCFEMDKNYSQTKLQLLLSPAVLIAKDTFQRSPTDSHLGEGHLGLSGLQVRGHAMFSHEGLPLDSETLEYGWLIEAIIGDLTGKLTVPQLQNLIEFIQTFIMLVDDPENRLQHPKSYKLCQHMIPQPQCRMLSKYPFNCPASEDIKYEMIRVSVDSVNLFLVESATAMNIQVFPVKLSTCNLHGTNTRAGITARVEHISLQQYVASSALKQDTNQQDLWLESGSLVIGPIDVEAAMALPNPDYHSIQDAFLKLHDKKTKRLWFLWPVDTQHNVLPIVNGKCGCLGGCVFFGNNKNGIGFFNLSKSKENTHCSAVLQISPDGQDPGFGQSLLCKDRLVFDVQPNNGALTPDKVHGFTFTRGYMSDVASIESPGTNVTVIEDQPPAMHYGSSQFVPQVDMQSDSLDRKSGTLRSTGSDSRSVKTMRSDSYTDKSVVTTPSEAGHWTIGGSSLETPISDTRSFTSRKGSLDESRKSVSHSNSLTSYDVSKSIQGQGSSPNLDVQSRSSSKKSLSSPFLRRQDLSDRAFSAVSLESERYFSADEDVHSLGEQKDDSMLTEDDINITIKSQNSTTTSQGNETITDDDRDKTLRAGEDGTVFTPKEHESTDSYESAPSDVTDSDEFDEDFDPDNISEIFSMVDLHSQVNKPIPESPILMSCYSGHMTHLQCNDWSAASPNQHFRYKYGMKADQSVYSLSSVGQSVQYVHSSACVPHFMRLRQGFSTKLMKTRDNFTATTPSRDGSIDILDPWSHAVETRNFEVHKTNTEQSLLDNASITTAVVKMTGSMDIVLTPLLLESIQRYAEAVTPTLQQLHPSALIDGLHSRCLDRLKQQNRLKKESLSSEENRASKLIQERQFSTESRTQTGEMKTSSIQALFTLAKINICTLQAGIMEEKIQFSALENIHDLTCVSLLAVCIDRIECQLLSNSHSCKMLADNAGMSNITQSGSSPKKTSSKKSEISFQAGEMDKQMTEISREEDVGTIHITRVHLQLQRLLKNSNYTDDVLLTAIPDYKSKVLFRFEKDALSDSFRFASSPRRRSSVKQESFGSSPKQHSRRQSSREGRPPFSRQSSKDSESRGSTLPRLFKQASIDEQGGSKVRRQESMSRHGGVGFIMFECGLEEIKVTAVRRLGFKDVSDERFLRKMENVAQKLEEIQNSTRVQLETSLGQLDEERTNATPRFKLNDEDMTSVHSWDSRVSIASGSTSLSEKETNKPLTGDASSGTLELHTVWLNFAAPPPVSIKRKVDFTRLDWNLLSTATTAINGWLNPLDRMVTEIQRMVQTLTHRTNSVMACVMTNALEVPGIQLPYKSKYSKITSLARTFQEDPSCQLFTVLRKYLQKEGTGPVEIAVTADTLPQLITIQKGILALTRQWKNVLYMPNISNIDFKSKKSIHPYNVKFSLAPDFTDDGNETECADQYDVVDERTSLLLAEGGSVHQSVSISDLTEQKLDGQDMHDGTSFASALSSKHKKTSSGLKPPFVYGSPGSPQAGNMESPERRFTPVPGMTRNDSNYSFHSAAASLHSAEHDPSPPNTPMKLEPPKPSILKNKIDKTHDLYQWMAKQQDFKGMSLEEDSQSLRRQDSLMATFGSGWSQDDSRLDLTERQLAMATSIVQLADAQSLFKPFLQSIGLHVEAVRPTAMMKKFGGSLSLQGKLEFLKIQITDSEKHRSKKGKKVKLVHFKDNASAFSCENFSVSVGMKDVVDFESKEQGDGGERGDLQFSFAMHKLEAKPTTLQVNFMINCETVTQNVDMPLLRLIHQFATMAENVKDTKQELKQSHTNDEWTKTHRKQDSKDSSSSVDTQQSDTSQTNQFSPGSGEAIPAGWKKENITSQLGNVLESGQEKAKPLRSSPAPYRKTIGSPKVDNLQLPLKRLSQGKEQRKLGLPGSEGQRSEDKSQAVLTPPQSLNLSDSVTIEMEDVSSPVLAEKTLVDEIKETTPKCWRTLYHILDLYSTLPEMKTVKRKPSSKLPVIEEEPEPEQGLRDGNFEPADTPSDTSRIGINRIGETTTTTGATAAEEGRARMQQNTNDTAKSTFNKTKFKQSIYVGESIPLVVFGIAKVEKVNILAVLSGLKLEACLDNVHASGTYREKVKGFVHRKSSESSATAHIGNTLMKLKEGLPPHMQTVVTVTIAKSQALHTTILRKGKEHNSAMVSIGIIDIDIPQHPVVLHGMMARSTRQLSTTLQEFRRPTSRSSRNLDIPERSEVDATNPQDSLKRQKNVKVTKQENTNRPTFINIHFKAMFQGLTTGASLLPSLKAQHKTGKITLSGMTGKKARFRLDLPSHQLSFRSKVQTTETSLPSEAEIELPPIQMFADYRHQGRSGTGSENLTDGLTLKEGSYLNAEAEVGMLEHSLTTDLLNHLVFVQKVFMTEVNDLVQKVSGSDQPVPLWVEEGEKVVKESTSSLLYSLLFRFKGIQITATTPTSSAVRLETGSVNLEVSNRVQMEARETTQEQQQTAGSQKMFMKAQIDLNLALGQLIKNALFEEAEPEFQTMAFFKTKIGIRNALQDEMIPGVSRDQEALLITLTRPIILAQPQAFDKAVLVWLNYKNAYEYWTEQRLALNNEVQRATRQFIDRIPQMTSTTPSSFSTLFLQLTVEDMGICVPVLANTLQMQGTNTTSRFIESEPGSALVFTLKSTQISACSSGSLVSKGRFQDFCLRFADDFETSWDDWKPAPIEDPVMNACVVPEGTYEVCSRTINKQASDPLGNAKWILNVQWEMQGIAVHLDTKIGKQLSALGKTLTSLTGDDDNDFMEEDEDQRLDSIFSQSDEFINLSPQRRPSQVQDSLPPYVYDTSMDPKQRFRLIEQEMNEQAKLVQDLKQLGASQQTIETESKKLEELKGILFQDFRREVLNKLKNKSESRTLALKDQLGIGNIPTSHLRSKSYGGPIKEKKTHTDIDRLAAYNEELNHSRITSLDMTRTLPAKVQFGDTSAYSPPETPDSLTSSTETSHHSDSPSHSGRPYSESPSHCGRSYSESPSHSGRPYPDSPSHSGRPHPDSPSHYGRQNLDSPSHSGRPHPVVRNISSTESSTSTDSEEEDGTLKRDSVFDSSFTIPEDYQAHSSKHDTLTPSVGSGGSSGKGSTEPNVDFELDVKVFIDSGKCVLHPKDNKEEEVKRNHQKRDKTPTPDSPPPGRRKKKFSESGSTPLSSQSKKCGTPQQQQQQQIDLTVFFLPSIDLKVHYNSKISPGIMDATSNPDIGDDKSESEGRVASTDEEVVLRKKPIALRHSPVTQDSVDSSVSFTSARRLGVKKANLYAWLSLQSLPEEMIISPCLLDFLEQALEPLPLGLVTGVQSSKKVDVVGSVLNVDLESSYSSLPLITSQTSFPVDVVVFIRVEPSVIRFNCLPTSRVECLLKVPALEFVFSTKSSDIEGNFSEGTPPMKNKVPKKSRDRHTSGGKSSTDFRTRVGSTASQADQSSSMSAGGLSFTAALSDFSLYIFHPYGGGAQRKLATPTYNLGSIQEHGGAWSEMSRRDMLSLNVEFVKLNISRSRKLEMKMTESGVKEPLTKSNVVRFSTICDIGSAAFKYDMRRLSEILTFPKAWYNRNLARRMFLGDESYVQTGEDEWESSSSTGSYHSDTTPSPVAKLFTSSPTLHQLTVPSEPFRQTHHRRVSSGDKMKVQLSTELKNVIDSRAPRKGSVSVPQSPTDAVFHDGTLHGTPVAHRSRHRGSLTQSEILKQKRSSVGQVSAKPAITWETLVLFAVNLSKLDLHVNMSNVMGNTVWTTQQIKSQGRLAIDSSGHKDLNITSGMGSSQFESKGGVVGGTIDLNDLSVTFEVCEDPQDGRQPLHCAVFNLQALECRMDYMGSSVLMARLSQLAIKLKDEWHVQAKAENDTPLATQRPAFLFAHGDFEWDQFHIMISRSTTPDIIKMVSKIEEFITMQFNSSKRMLSSIGPLSGGRRTSDRNRKLSDEEDCIWDIRHHRHWQKALSLIIGCRFSMLPSLIPKEGTILGGNITLKGKNLTLACFHGINFRSKSWALFTVNEPLIMFETESQKLPQGGIHIVENLTFSIGHDFTSTYRDNNTMVSIAKLSRTHSMPPTFTSVQEWFHYAFATSEVKGLDNFPHISHVDDDGPIRRLRKLQTYNHDTEMIFILPCLQLHLKTIHTQTEEEPQADDPKPVVECSFVTEFEDHIRVAMDAELILFLHDLVYMYIKEKDKGTKPSYSQSGKTTGKSPDTERKKVTDPTTALKQDWRDFKCNTWHLEPTVRLLHWASKQIDPVGVDALLQKLGFTHARVTIPKWMQRGFMDPLDRFISFLIERLILALKENNPEQDLTETDEG